MTTPQNTPLPTFRTLSNGITLILVNPARGTYAPVDSDAGAEEAAQLDAYEAEMGAGFCSICDALGHGYPGGPPCPLEDSGRYDGEPAWAV